VNGVHQRDLDRMARLEAAANEGPKPREVRFHNRDGGLHGQPIVLALAGTPDVILFDGSLWVPYPGSASDYVAANVTVAQKEVVK